MPLLVAHVEDVLGVVAGDGGEGESGEDDGDDAGGDEARLEGVPARIINSIKYTAFFIRSVARFDRLDYGIFPRQSGSNCGYLLP